MYKKEQLSHFGKTHCVPKAKQVFIFQTKIQKKTNYTVMLDFLADREYLKKSYFCSSISVQKSHTALVTIKQLNDSQKLQRKQINVWFCSNLILSCLCIIRHVQNMINSDSDLFCCTCTKKCLCSTFLSLSSALSSLIPSIHM